MFGTNFIRNLVLEDDKYGFLRRKSANINYSGMRISRLVFLFDRKFLMNALDTVL
jgi:hypothetical protein